MSLLNALDVGARGLGLASAGIDVTTQNITGAKTAGYTRRTLRSRALAPVQQGGLWVGQGATPQAVARSVDRLLGVRLIDGTGASSSASTLAERLGVVESYFDSSNTTGIAEALDVVFDSLASATTDPSDLSLRRGVVQSAQAFSAVVTRVANGLADTVAAFDEELGAGLDEVNATLREIANLNGVIGKQGAIGGPGDLLDRRDELILELAEKVGATAELKADGQAVVYVAGHEIVSGSDARSLSVATDADGATAIHLSVDGGALDVTDLVGGRVGGLTEARSRTEGWLNDLDELAFTVATAFNTQHAAGFDANGAAGGDFFTTPGTAEGAALSLAVSSTLAAEPARLAFAGATAADPGDGTNLEALLELEDAALFTQGTARARVSSLVSDVGGAVAAAETDADAQSALVGDLATLRDAASGVNTDEEAGHLLEYQAAYRAAARVMTVADELLRTLLQIAG